MFQIYGWEPEYYNDPKALPEDMPKELKDYIINNATKLQVTYYKILYLKDVCFSYLFWEPQQKKTILLIEKKLVEVHS